MRRFTLLLALAACLLSCMRAEVKLARSMTINDVPISSIPDGSYTGSYTYGGFTYTVRCIVSEGRVDKIKILHNRETSRAKMAESVIGKVVEWQKVTVDAVTGATATSKALLKATEKALAKGASRAAE